jgi:hypothetical protein
VTLVQLDQKDQKVTQEHNDQKEIPETLELSDQLVLRGFRVFRVKNEKNETRVIQERLVLKGLKVSKVKWGQ